MKTELVTRHIVWMSRPRAVWGALSVIALASTAFPAGGSADVVTPHAVKPQVVIPQVVTASPAPDRSSAASPPDAAPASEPVAEPAAEPAADPASTDAPSVVERPSAIVRASASPKSGAPTGGDCRDGSCEPPIPPGGKPDRRLSPDSLAAQFIGQVLCPLWLTFHANVAEEVKVGRAAGLSDLQMSWLMAELENSRAHIWRTCVTTRDP